MTKFGSLKQLLGLVASVALFAVVPAGIGFTAGPAKPSLADTIKKAAQEGEVVYQGPDPATSLSTAGMLRDMEAVTEKYFDVKIRVKLDNALSFPTSVTKALTEIKANAPPTFDLMYQISESGSPLYREKAIEAVPWRELFPHVKAQDLEYNGLALISHTGFVVPAYNSRSVKTQEVPKTWEDILDRKWKGRLGLPIYPGPWLLFAQSNAWGEERTLSYLKRLMELNPKLGRFPEVHERVVSGETPLAWGQHRERTLSAKESLGAPVDVADQVEPALLWVNILLIPKGARHANAAALVAAAMLTKEGQDIQLRYQSTTSMFRPETPAAKYASKHKTIMPDVDFILKRGPELSKKINAILIKR
ncbi:MAG: extracellular solute-binding protein [Deltaproteobacteria bacterium]|nr:extracellular solute-binding protein [Deltaproteobacteria bacterium]